MILVTGGTGLVGSHLLMELVQTEKKVRAIFRKNSDLDAVKHVFSYYRSPEDASRLYHSIEWVEASLEDVPALSMAFEGIEKVYHCAALVSFNSKDANALRKTNIEGTANVVNLCISRRIKKLCYISSIATLDLLPGESHITENFTWFPEKDHSEYAISKHGAEIEVWRGTQEGVPAVILNPGVIIGPGYWEKGTGQIFKKIDEGLNYHFPKTTGFVGVLDVVQLAVLAMNSEVGNQQFIVISENTDFKTVFDTVAKNFDRKPPQNVLKPWMVYLGWIFQSLGHYLWGAKKQISSNDHKSLFEHTHYSNEKARNTFDYDFTPLNLVISETAKRYRSDRRK